MLALRPLHRHYDELLMCIRGTEGGGCCGGGGGGLLLLLLPLLYISCLCAESRPDVCEERSGGAGARA